MHAPRPWTRQVTEPWFRERPEFTLALAAVLYATVFTLRLLLGDIGDGYNMLYTLPIALLATAFGRRAGIVAAVVAVALIVVWVVVDEIPMSPTRWITRLVPMLLLGLLVGDASDRLRRAEEERVQLAAAARMHREAIEINDSLIQGMAAAKWSIEAGRTEAGLATLDDTIALGHQLVSELIRDAGLGMETGRVAPSRAESDRTRPPPTRAPRP